MSKILICDDDEGILDLVEFVLGSEGFDTIPEINSLNVANLVKKEAGSDCAGPGCRYYPATRYCITGGQTHKPKICRY